MRVVIETLDGERLWEREHGKGMRDLLHDTAAFFAIGAMIAGISLMLAGLIL